MNFQQLEYVIAIDEHKTFSEAAHACNVAQATLSAMVIRLEKELDFRIFDRTTKPVTTTELGAQFLEKAKEMLSLKNASFQIGKSFPETISGELSIGVIPTIANSLLPLVLPTILEENPDLELRIREITTKEIIRNLQLGELDIAIAATPLNEKNIEEEILYYEPMLVYGIEPSDKKYIVSDEMLEKKIWLLEEGHCFRDQVSTICELKNKETDIKNLVFEGNSFETLLSMVDAFGGYTLIPELYYLQMNPINQLRSKMFQKPIPVREVSIISHAPTHKIMTTQYLAKCIKERVQPLLSTHSFNNDELRIVGFD